MANGYREALLLHLKTVLQNPDLAPARKITPPGYLKMLLENQRPNIISTGREEMGHVRDVRVKYQTRGISGNIGSEDNCDIDVVPVYAESTINSTLFRKMGLFIDDTEIAKYETEASRLVNLGNSPTPFMNEHLESVLNKANGLIASVNAALLTLQASAFGAHQETGNANTVNHNFPIDRTNNNLAEGMSGLLARVINNELSANEVVLVGSGLILSYMLQQPAKQADQAGLVTNLEFLPKLFWDPATGSAWGANQFGVFEKNAVQLIEIDKFVNGFSGPRPGGSSFWNAPLPLKDSIGDALATLNFDMQLKYYDCPTEVSLNGYQTQSINRGYVLTLSKTFHQFNIPSDAYEATDRITGNRGSLRFTATNS